MASAPEGEELSVATVSDLQDVLDMSGDVYDGVDYLPSSFPDLVEGPGVKAFLYRVKGELAAFSSTKILDEGQSLLLQGSRVKKTFQGQGVYSRFRRKLFDQFLDRKLYPHLRREVTTVNVFNVQNHADKMRKSGFREVLAKYGRMFEFNASSLSQLTVEKPRYQVTALTSDALQQLLQADPAHWLHLFPQKRVLVNWKPYDAIPDNLQYILAVWNAKFYGSQKSPDHEYSMLSAGTYYPCQLGMYYFIDVFGTPEREEVKNHITAHLQRLKGMAHALTGKVVFSCYATEMSDDIVQDVLQQIDSCRLEEMKLQETISLWERDLHSDEVFC